MNRLPAWHQDFLRMLPTIRQVAHVSFRHLHGDAYDDAVEEVVEDYRTPVAGQAAFRCDFPAWLGGQGQDRLGGGGRPNRLPSPQGYPAFVGLDLIFLARGELDLSPLATFFGRRRTTNHQIHETTVHFPSSGRQSAKP